MKCLSSTQQNFKSSILKLYLFIIIIVTLTLAFSSINLISKSERKNSIFQNKHLVNFKNPRKNF